LCCLPAVKTVRWMTSNEAEVDHRTLPRIRWKFDHERALYCITSDYLGQSCHYYDKEFKQKFMVSHGWFKSIAKKLSWMIPSFIVRINQPTRS
jgi:hypothetical protein